MLVFLGFHRIPSQPQTSVILVWKEPIKLALLFLGNNSLDDYNRIFAFTVKSLHFVNYYFQLVPTYIRFVDATGSAFTFPFTSSFEEINQSRGVGCLIFSLFAGSVILKSGNKKKRQWLLHLTLSTSIIHELCELHLPRKSWMLRLDLKLQSQEKRQPSCRG